MDTAPWDARRLAAVAVGGIAGASLRWAITTATALPGPFPWAVTAINVAGSFVLGVLLALEWEHPHARVVLHDAGAIGFCGGFTTLSTFALEVVELQRSGHTSMAVAYVVASVAGALAAVVAGAAVVRQVRALRLPVEGQP